MARAAGAALLGSAGKEKGCFEDNPGLWRPMSKHYPVLQNTDVRIWLLKVGSGGT